MAPPQPRVIDYLGQRRIDRQQVRVPVGPLRRVLHHFGQARVEGQHRALDRLLQLRSYGFLQVRHFQDLRQGRIERLRQLDDGAVNRRRGFLNVALEAVSIAKVALHEFGDLLVFQDIREARLGGKDLFLALQQGLDGFLRPLADAVVLQDLCQLRVGNGVPVGRLNIGRPVGGRPVSGRGRRTGAVDALTLPGAFLVGRDFGRGRDYARRGQLLLHFRQL